jgi:hypothetical protein
MVDVDVLIDSAETVRAVAIARGLGYSFAHPHMSRFAGRMHHLPHATTDRSGAVGVHCERPTPHRAHSGSQRLNLIARQSRRGSPGKPAELRRRGRAGRVYSLPSHHAHARDPSAANARHPKCGAHLPDVCARTCRVRDRAMEWSGRALAPLAIKAAKGANHQTRMKLSQCINLRWRNIAKLSLRVKWRPPAPADFRFFKSDQ